MASKKKNYIPWARIRHKDYRVFQRLTKHFVPAVLLKPGDLWKNLHCRFRVAILKQPHQGRYISMVRLAFHMIWDTPTRKDIRKRHPNWNEATVEYVYQQFKEHERFWGIKDVELVAVTLRRKKKTKSLTSFNPQDFEIIEINYRNGAHFKGVVKQILKWEWDKLGRKFITVDLKKKKNREAFKWQDSHIILVVDSYHHSFFSPKELGKLKVKKRIKAWKHLVRPKVAYFAQSFWNRYRMHKDDPVTRDQESWERG